MKYFNALLSAAISLVMSWQVWKRSSCHNNDMTPAITSRVPSSWPFWSAECSQSWRREPIKQISRHFQIEIKQMRRQAELITSPHAPDPNINFVKIDFLRASRRSRCSNENKRILSGGLVWCVVWKENTIDRISHISYKWLSSPQQLVSILIFISQPFKQRLPALPSVVLSGSLLHRTVRQ